MYAVRVADCIDASILERGSGRDRYIYRERESEREREREQPSNLRLISYHAIVFNRSFPCTSSLHNPKREVNNEREKNEEREFAERERT